MGTSKLFIYFSFLVISVSVFGAMPPPHKCPYWMSHGIVRRTEREREKGPSKADFLQGMSKCSSLSVLTLFRKQSIPFYPLYGQRKQLPQSLYLYTPQPLPRTLVSGSASISVEQIKNKPKQTKSKKRK